MTTEEKIKRFMDITVKDATVIKENSIAEYQKSLDQIYEEHKDSVMRQSKIQIKHEAERVKREVNIELSRQQLHIKRKITKKQSALKEQLFEEIKALLVDYMKTKEYVELLVSQIEHAKEYAGNQYVIIYLDPNDSDKLDYLAERTGITPRISGYSFLGGIRTVIPYKNILIDDSFEKKIMNEKEKFVFGGSSNE